MQGEVLLQVSYGIGTVVRCSSCVLHCLVVRIEWISSGEATLMADILRDICPAPCPWYRGQNGGEVTRGTGSSGYPPSVSGGFMVYRMIDIVREVDQRTGNMLQLCFEQIFGFMTSRAL